jgi:Holliday junction resolvasome RuvABC endonuclease subunit
MNARTLFRPAPQIGRKNREARLAPDFGGFSHAQLDALTDQPILALDLASHVCGWALYWLSDEKRARAGSIMLSQGRARTQLGDRIATLSRSVYDLYKTAGGTGDTPALIAVETPDLMVEGMVTNPNTLKSLYACLGAVYAFATDFHVPVLEVDPRHVKARTTGNLTANKGAVQQYLERRGFTLGQTVTGMVDHDAADALALAVVVADEAHMIRLAKRIAL